MKTRLFPVFFLLASANFALAAPKISPPSAKVEPFQMADDKLEARWSYRANLDARGAGSAAWLLGRGVVALEPSGTGLKGTFSDATTKRVTTFTIPSHVGEFDLVRVGKTLSVLWDGHQCAKIETDLGGDALGTRVSGSWKKNEATYQPTEPVVFRDDFMRVSGPDSPEVPGEWKVQGNWKTSGTLGPLADAALSPNPFVFRASGEGEETARAGKWFWNGYSVSASVRANASGSSDLSAFSAGLEAFDSPSGGIRGEINFKTGVASLVQLPTGSFAAEALSTNGTWVSPADSKSSKLLAQSAPFDAGIGQWHRLRLEPKNGTIALFFDGREVVRAKCDLVQGTVALHAQTGGTNFVDFDDVRVGEPESGQATWGEGTLPDRLVKDRLMKNWASAASAWKRDGKGVWWHTGDFWKDATLEVPLPELKEGEGFRVYMGADSSSPEGAALQVSLRSRNEKVELRTDEKSAPLVLDSTPANKMILHVGEWKKEARAGFFEWNGKKIPVSGRFGNGTKIGIEPTQNGAAVAAAGLAPLSLQAPTRLRDGQAVIGVNISEVTPQLVRDLGLPDGNGVVIDHVEEGAPAQKAGFQNGDIVRQVNGARVVGIESMRAAVGSVQAPAPVTLDILRPRHDESNLDWANCSATTTNELDYAFTSAPTDWKPARGTWQVAERWTCSPQWSFFSGSGDEFPLLWSRFALKGDWTLEAYLASPMDLTRGERSPTDLNISVGDGQRVSSGYSFAFAAQNRSNNLVWRGNSLVKTFPFVMPSLAGDTHQDWFYVRLEKRHTANGTRFKWSVNGQAIGDYEDTSPIAAANRLAFWTKNGALSIARVRVWHEGVEDLPLAPRVLASANKEIPNVLGVYAPRDAGPDASARLSLVASGGAKVLEIENPHDGGDWTTYLSRQPFDPASKNGVLSFDYRVGANVKLNLYALTGGEWREIGWTGGPPQPGSNQRVLGAIADVKSDDSWHSARFDLRAALAQNGLAGQTVDALAFAAPARDYLRQGLGGNAKGAKFWLRNLQTFPSDLARPVSATIVR